MQNHTSSAENRRGQNTTDWPRRGPFDPSEVIETALILYADLPSVQIAGILAEELDRGNLIDIARTFLLRAIRSVRRKQAKSAHQQFILPGFGMLPARIRGKRAKEKPLVSATYEDVACYIKQLGVSYAKRKRNDVKLKQAKALLAKMRVASKRKRGITVGEVFGLLPLRPAG